RLLLTLLLVPLLVCLVACGGKVKFQPNPQQQQQQPNNNNNAGIVGQAAPPPRFTIETGLMDPWDMKKAGPTQMVVSPDGKYLLTLAMSSRENVQVWDLGTKQKLHGIRNDIGTMHAHVAIAPDSRTAAYVQLRPKAGIV